MGTTKPKPGVTAYIIAFNEAEKITAAIKSVLWADEVLLVDSYSTDGTTEIAESLGVRVIHIAFKGYGQLRNEALTHIRHEWVFSLDADERCTQELAQEIRLVVDGAIAGDVFFVPRKNYFMGRWIKHSGWYPNYRQPQLFRLDKMKYDSLPVHEGYVLQTDLPPKYLKNHVYQFPFKDVGEILRKADKYSSLGAKKLEFRRLSVPIALAHGLWAFIKHYIFKLGFLDGAPGLIIAIGNFEGTFYRYLKALEERRGPSELDRTEEHHKSS
jgi:glycosyltransferase involved in cell wall biosynthesis